MADFGLLASSPWRNYRIDMGQQITVIKQHVRIERLSGETRASLRVARRRTRLHAIVFGGTIVLNQLLVP